jgi:CO/xanthine dehydrogenase Mo-binding subunit
MDIEHISVGLYENPDPYGPFGARGIGEPLLVAPAPAIGNAIYNAIGGNRILSSPQTPEKILAAIGKG